MSHATSTKQLFLEQSPRLDDMYSCLLDSSFLPPILPLPGFPCCSFSI